MKKTKLSIAALTLVLAVGSTAPIFAADEDYRKADTPVEFELQKGTVVDPEVTDPTDPHPGVETDFRIWYVPTKFEFASGKISATEQTYNLSGSNKTKVAVADVRDARDGWNLGAAMTDLTNGTTSTKLVGAKISWDQEVFEIADPEEVETYSASDVTAESTLTIDKEVTSVMKAEDGKGFGYHTANLSNIKLTVPAKTGDVGTYTGKVNWTLTKTPAVQE